jgi:cell wall-associated NlpC family hydrolase
VLAKATAAVLAATVTAVALFVAVMAGATGARGGAAASATVVSLEDLAARTCVGPAFPNAAAAAADLTPVRAQNAAAIVAVAEAAGIGEPGAVIAVMAADTESALETTAVNGDHIGLFQQSPSWGTTPQRLDPTVSAALFVRRLETVAGWQQLEPWVAAEAVQASQFNGVPSSSNSGSSAVGGNYEANYPLARQIVAATAGNGTDSGCGQQQGVLPAAPDGKGGLPSTYQVPPSANPAETRAISFALSKVGGPYVWGGNGPTGYDCSGLVTAAWAYAGVAIPRTSQAELGAGTAMTSYESISPGDLVLVPGSGDGGTLAAPGHVAMYIGDGLVVAAADTQVGIIVQTYQSAISGGLSGIRHIA